MKQHSTMPSPRPSDLPPPLMAGQSSSPCISTENLSVKYGSHQALGNVSLSIQSMKITALVGPSGSGKTSFLTCLNRLTDLVPHCHVDGSIRFGNIDVCSSETDVLQLRRRIGMIFQNPNPFPFSIRKNLTFPLKEHGVGDPGIIDAKVQESLTRVGLWDEVCDRLDSSALALSGGQQQRLCIARALILSPEVLLMDEPCSALDPLSSGIVEDLITHLRDQYTIILVTHNLAQARRIADQVALFWIQGHSGTLIEARPTGDFFHHPQHRLTQEYIDGVRG
ncbi:phosphate ABC transporter ATP-binding protein [Candidatus Nitronereus thalassa]|uniref:Phosphate ABC transporter ATP-binding protein n=1 Tax=Candidatus Nitronereus thalassa TaxID=3020898 RepID=A0ABU3K9V1_9BACT|nr:phosphate ABC transporter ATP-binding protein [Candidatus Nitronereus thalassa]MDT7043196.1 phosphate ABC transporter ATP-binding protein [Candidatus Nitronereus thalassa]